MLWVWLIWEWWLMVSLCFSGLMKGVNMFSINLLFFVRIMFSLLFMQELIMIGWIWQCLFVVWICLQVFWVFLGLLIKDMWLVMKLNLENWVSRLCLMVLVVILVLLDMQNIGWIVDMCFLFFLKFKKIVDISLC